MPQRSCPLKPRRAPDYPWFEARCTPSGAGLTVIVF
jgi:hypothetical protein